MAYRTRSKPARRRASNRRSNSRRPARSYGRTVRRTTRRQPPQTVKIIIQQEGPSVAHPSLSQRAADAPKVAKF